MKFKNPSLFVVPTDGQSKSHISKLKGHKNAFLFNNISLDFIASIIGALNSTVVLTIIFSVLIKQGSIQCTF